MNIGNLLVKRAKLVYWTISLPVTGVFLLCLVILLQSLWVALFGAGWFIILCYWAYLDLIAKRKPRYPLVPPEGKPDGYTGIGIPRPIHEDFDEMKRKREKLEELKKISRRKKR